MNLPPLYKYLDISGAKLTLENQTFKHSKPSDFNDTQDLTINGIFTESIEDALERIAGGFTDVILQHIHEQPTCSSPMKEQIQILQQFYQVNPSAAEKIRRELPKATKQLHGNGYYRELTKAHVTMINAFMQNYRVLCVTTHLDSEYMWTKYAEKHRGIALRIEPNIYKDSKFQRFRSVIYRNQRPPLYEDPLEFYADFLFGDQDARIEQAIDRIIYTKTLDWEKEGEYRLAIPIVGNEDPWSALPYHPTEITELYLGCDMGAFEIGDIVDKARAVNPYISIFRSRRDDIGKLFFEIYK